MKILLSYISVLTALAVLDSVWFRVVAKSFYGKEIGHLMRAEPVWLAIIIFYLLYAGAVVFFVVMPAGGSWTKALLLGALLGFTVYMTYELVNYAILKDWAFSVVIPDILWGMFMTASAALAGFFVL